MIPSRSAKRASALSIPREARANETTAHRYGRIERKTAPELGAVSRRIASYCPSWARTRTLLIQNAADQQKCVTLLASIIARVAGGVRRLCGAGLAPAPPTREAYLRGATGSCTHRRRTLAWSGVQMRSSGATRCAMTQAAGWQSCGRPSARRIRQTLTTGRIGRTLAPVARSQVGVARCVTFASTSARLTH